MTDLFAIGTLALLLVNCWAALRFWQDKQRARTGRQRISEADRLGPALIGGSPAALLAVTFFVTRPERSRSPPSCLAIVVVQVGASIGLVIAFSR